MKELTLSNEVVTINGRPVKKIYGGFGDNQPCILAKQVAELHGQELKRINELINNNLDWFEEGIDYVNLAVVSNDRQKLTDFLLNFYTQDALNASKYVYLFSQQGYALLCKLLKSDLARQIYKQMVREYFIMKEKLEDRSARTQMTGEWFDLSVKRFKTATEAVTLMGIKDRRRARQIANEITKDTTGTDLMAFMLPYCSRDFGDSNITIPSSPGNDEEENLIIFVSAWWEKYGEEAADSHYLRLMIIDNDLPFDLGGGNQRSQKIRLSRTLGKMKGRAVGGYHITEAGTYRNAKLWKLRPATKQQQAGLT